MNGNRPRRRVVQSPLAILAAENRKYAVKVTKNKTNRSRRIWAKGRNPTFLSKRVAFFCNGVYNYARQNKVGGNRPPSATKERKKTMKKLLSLVLALTLTCVCILSFASCGKKGKTLEEVKAAGKLVIATSPDFPPFENLDEDGKVVGIEVDIMKLICAALGVEMVLEQVDFESVLPGVKATKYDCGMSGITVTESRQKNMLFTDSYCLAAQSIVVKEDSTIESKADLAGKKVSVQTGTTAEEFCMKNGYTVSAFQTNPDAELELINGRVDAWVIDNLTALEMVAAYNADPSHTTQLVILDEVMTTEPYAFAFAFGSEDLVAEINKTLQALLKDGTIKTLFALYEAPYIAPSAAE